MLSVVVGDDVVVVVVDVVVVVVVVDVNVDVNVDDYNDPVVVMNTILQI